MALVTVDAVVNVISDSLVISVCLVLQVAIGALEYGIVVRIGMAGRTDSVGIAVIDGELRVLGMIESSVQPTGGVVAGLAGGGEKLRLRHVPRIGGGVVVSLVAPDASGRQGRVIVVDVTVGALPRRDRVHPGQRERGVVVVEGRVGPQDGVVADFALLRESNGDVIGSGGAVEVRQVARNAGGAVQGVVVVRVAIGAEPRRNSVRSGQRESGGRVIKHSVGPLHCVMAIRAGRRDSRGDVRERRHRVVVVGQVARNAGGVCDVVVIVDVAVGALQRRDGVASGEREAGAVVIESGIEP